MDWTQRPGVAGTNRKPLLKRDIEAAQAQSLSAAGAARYLGVSYDTYRKYATLYGLHASHVNPSGKGVPKVRSAVGAYSLHDILDGQHPSYDVKKLKHRLLKEGVFDEACTICGFHERRVTDYKVPLILVFKDGDRRNHKLDNLTILCYNCCFLTMGDPSAINTLKVRRLAEPDPSVTAPGDDSALSPDELEAALAEARSELMQARTE